MNFEVNADGGWVVPANTSIPSRATIPAYSVLGNECTLGDGCTLGNGCKLGGWCKLGNGCTLGNGCKLGVWCNMEDGLVLRWITLSNVDGSGRQILVIVRPDASVVVRAGCFRGTVIEFVARAAEEGKHTYAAVIPAVAAALSHRPPASGSERGTGKGKP